MKVFLCQARTIIKDDTESKKWRWEGGTLGLGQQDSLSSEASGTNMLSYLLGAFAGLVVRGFKLPFFFFFLKRRLCL